MARRAKEPKFGNGSHRGQEGSPKDIFHGLVRQYRQAQLLMEKASPKRLLDFIIKNSIHHNGYARTPEDNEGTLCF